jgi:hypothetical protein
MPSKPSPRETIDKSPPRSRGRPKKAVTSDTGKPPKRPFISELLCPYQPALPLTADLKRRFE